jgi:uncharacterized protein
MRIVLDTNVLLQIISSRSPHFWIWNALRKHELTLCVTTDILDEYHEIITQFYGSSVLADNILDAILSWTSLVKVEKYYFWGVPYKDPDDQKFIDCTVACGAHYLVSEDKVFFKELKKNKLLNVQVIKPKVFLSIFENRKE